MSSPESMIKIAFLGDVFPGVMPYSLNTGDQAQEVVIPTNLPLGECQIVFCNFEGTLFHGPQRPFRGAHLYAGNHSLALLQKLNINVISLANNHILDHGFKSALKTKNLFENNGIKTTGFGKDPKEANKEVSFIANDKKISFLSFTTSDFYVNSITAGPLSIGCASMRKTNVLRQIKRVRPTTDYLFLYFHWGYEFMNIPSPEQKDLARLCIEAGADGVLGSHAHVIQAFETYKGKPIFYGLGNFLFPNFTRLSGEIYTWETDSNLSLVPVLSLDPHEVTVPEVKIHYFHYHDNRISLLAGSALQELELKLKEWNSVLEKYDSTDPYIKSTLTEIKARKKKWKVGIFNRWLKRWIIWPAKTVIGEYRLERLRLYLKKKAI